MFIIVVSEVFGKIFNWLKCYARIKELLYRRKFDTRCQAMRQEVVRTKFQPHASQMHLKWAEIRYCTQYTVYNNELLRFR